MRLRLLPAYTLRTKLTLVLLAVMLLPFGALAGLNYWATQRALTDQAIRSLSAAATQTARNLEAFLAQNRDTVNGEAQFPVFAEFLALPIAEREVSPVRREALLLLSALKNKEIRSSSLTGQYAFVEAYLLLDQQGTVALSTTAADTLAQNFAEREFFKTAFANNQPYMSSVEFDAVTNVAQLFFAARIISRDLQPVGVLVVRYNAAVFQNFIAANNDLAGAQSAAILLDENALILAHGLRPGVVFKIAQATPAERLTQLQLYQRAPGGTLNDLALDPPPFEPNQWQADSFTLASYLMGGGPVQVTTAALTRPAWRVLFFQPQAIFLEAARTQATQTLILSGGLALLAILVALGAARWITAPIGRLTQAARQVAGGDLTVQASVEAEDEVGELATTLNATTTQLRDTLTGLEARVRDLMLIQMASLRFGSVLNQRDIAQALVESVGRLINASDTRVFLLEANAQLHLVAAQGDAVHQADFAVAPRPEGLTAQVARGGQTMVINDPAHHPLFAQTMSTWNVTAIAGLPLKRGERVVGVLNVGFVDEPHQFSTEEISVLTTLAEQAALALDNARLYEASQTLLADLQHARDDLAQLNVGLEHKVTERTHELGQHVEQLDLINRVGRYATLIRDQQVLLPTVAELIRAAYDYYATLIVLVEPKRQALMLEAIALADNLPLFEINQRPELPAASVAHRVLKTGEPLALNEAELTAYTPVHERLATQSELALPLRVRDELLGVLDLHSRQPAAFQPDQIQVYQILADQIAVAIYNARLFQAEAQARRTTSTLLEAGQAVGSTLNLDEVLKRILASLSAVLAYDSAAIMLLKEGVLHIRAVSGFASSEDVIGVRLPLADFPLNREVVETGNAVVFNDVLNDPRWKGETPGANPVRSWIGAPLAAAGGVIGMLTIDSYQQMAYTEAYLPLVMTFANQVSIALHNAELYEAAQTAQAASEEANQLKSQFLANMSHELRTPLNSIINFAYLMSVGAEGELSSDQEDLLHRIGDAGRHLLGLINDILDLAKIEAGRLELFLEEIDLRDTVQGALSTAQGLIRNKPVELLHELPDQLPAVRADRTRLRQILLNLISNAAKFTEHGHILVSAWQDQDEVVISVKDTGLGMTPDDVPKAFMEFVQLDGSLTRQAGGTGLGLPITKRFIELHGGRIWAESALGVGSTFSFTLPCVQVAQPVSPPPLEARVLVIEDDPVMRETIATQLEQGYQVIKLNDSRLALEKIRETKPDVVVLDVMMPHRNGWDILKELKDNPETQDIPVVICSVMREERLALSLDANDYLVKPVTHDDLRRVVRRLAPQGGKVLAVDDDQNALEIVRRMLGGLAYRVTTANDGFAGLAAAHDQTPDVIVLDLMMPGLSGFEVLAKLRLDPTTAEIPVVVVTAKDLTGPEREQLQSEAATLLQKGDFTAEEFLNTIRHTLIRHSSGGSHDH